MKVDSANHPETQSEKHPAVKTILNSAGMTLLEILVVLGIIGAVIAVLVPQVMGNLEKSKVKNTRLAMAQVTSALALYYGDCGSYPKSLEGLLKPDGDCPQADAEGYLKKEVKDAWNNSFSYESEGSKYTLKSLGKDRRDGGDGYNKDILSDE